MLVGQETDVYKIIFWTDDNRGCRIELKDSLNANQFGKANKHDFEQTRQLGPLVRLFSRTQARRILLTMPFKPGTGLNEATYTFVISMLSGR